MSIIFLVPRLPPAIDGIGDYSFNLIEKLSEDSLFSHCALSDIITIDGAKPSAELFQKRFSFKSNFYEFQNNSDELSKLLDNSSGDILFLQYISWAYDCKKGSPLWLVEVIEKWLKQSSKRKLIVMFHETWSTGLFFQRVFWYQSKQKEVLKKLLYLSDLSVTSSKPNRQALESLAPGKKIETIPIGSNFSNYNKSTKRWRDLLIMGRAASRLRAVKVHKKLLSILDKKQILDHIILAGECTNPQNDPSYEIIKNICRNTLISCEYNFSKEHIPKSVLECGISLMHTQSTYLLKSTSFHFAANLGQVPITIQEWPCDSPFQESVHYLQYKQSDCRQLIQQLQDPSLLEKISDDLLASSQEHLDWSIISTKWNNLIRSVYKQNN